MAAQGNITLDGQVYVPYGNVGGIATWSLLGDTDFGGGRSDLILSVTVPSREGIYRVKSKLTVPKTAETASACACVGDTLGRAIADVTLVIPSNYTAAERANFIDRIQAYVASAEFTAAGDELQPAW